MTNLVLSALGAFGVYAKNWFICQTKAPIAAQEKFLKELLQVQQNTDLGYKFGLSEIKTIDQFQERVPIWSYSNYEPYMQRIASGEPNVLTADPVIYINLTSGTTGTQKMIPVTRRFNRSLGKANVISLGFLVEAIQRESTLRSQPLELGKQVAANTVRLQGYTLGGIPYGPVTVGSYRMNRFFCEQAFAQPFTAMEIADSLSRHYTCLLFALANPQVRGITANFPMLMLQICAYLEQHAEELIWDIAHGTIAPWLNIEPEVRATLEKQWIAQPQRAAELRSVLRSTGRLTPKTAWSKLSAVGTARGGTSDFYFERFPDYFGDTPQFGGVYGTAEGTFGIYHDFNQDGSILALGSGFYEFIPIDQWEIPQPKTLLPTEVKVGECYRILVTSYGGCYRYDIGDVVEVVGFYEQTPLIVFRHRYGGLLSSTTEKTTEFHAAQAMSALQQEFGLQLEDFCITLCECEFPSPYLVNIELSAGQTIDNPAQFLQRFDHWLGEFNRPYRTVRSAQVPPPRLRILAAGSFAIVRQRQLQRGTSPSQLKILHISEDRQFLAGLVVLEEVRMPADLSRV
ncbi:GH3 auxin-responsive promoter family protein [Phormidium tenue FACHB-886]|nr:GH3 auxin-responsive promoter family protein [Phormidium tenue FACHB-886]